MFPPTPQDPARFTPLWLHLLHHMTRIIHICVCVRVVSFAVSKVRCTEPRTGTRSRLRLDIMPGTTAVERKTLTGITTFTFTCKLNGNSLKQLVSADF